MNTERISKKFFYTMIYPPEHPNFGVIRIQSPRKLGDLGGDNVTNETSQTTSDFVNQVVELINVERTQADLDPLQIDSQLSQAAQVHTESMANDDFFNHNGVDGSSLVERIKATGYQYSNAAENIAVGYRTPEAVVEAWMGSSGHRANILNPNLTEIGVGYEYLANDVGSVNHNSYWTTVFGTPV